MTFVGLWVGELHCNCCNVSFIIVASVFAVERLIETNDFEKCKRKLFSKLRRILSIVQTFLDGELFFYPASSCMLLCCSCLSACSDAPGASGWEKFPWAWLGLAPLPHLWALFNGSACIILFIFCCFWLATQWESTCELLCDGSALGMCASAGSLAEALAARVQVEDTAVFQWSNAFFLWGVRIIIGNKWARKY